MKKLFILLLALLFWGAEAAMAQDVYGKTIEVNQDTTICILDFVSNQSGNGELYVFNRVVNFNNGKNKIIVEIPETIEDLRFIKNCKQVSSRSFVFEKAGNFTFSYVKSGKRFRVLGDLNYTCSLLLDGVLAPDSILINSDEDLKKEVSVPLGRFEDCWWFWDELSEDNILPFSSNKVLVKDLLGDNTERLIILQTNDGSKNIDENFERCGYTRDTLVIIDKRLLNGISSNTLEEFSVTPTTQGFIIQEAKSGQHLCLYSLSGQLVWSEKAKGTSQQINLVGIPTGMYVLRVNNHSFKISL